MSIATFSVKTGRIPRVLTLPMFLPILSFSLCYLQYPITNTNFSTSQSLLVISKNEALVNKQKNRQCRPHLKEQKCLSNMLQCPQEPGGTFPVEGLGSLWALSAHVDRESFTGTHNIVHSSSCCLLPFEKHKRFSFWKWACVYNGVSQVAQW